MRQGAAGGRVVEFALFPDAGVVDKVDRAWGHRVPTYTGHQQAQAIFASELPSIPLYLRLKVAATRPDFCGFVLDSSSTYALADIESFDYGESCP
jgi:hypothetical protein